MVLLRAIRGVQSDVASFIIKRGPPEDTIDVSVVY